MVLRIIKSPQHHPNPLRDLTTYHADYIIKPISQMENKMKISLNGQQKDVTEGLTISDLLGELKLKGPLAVEMNQKICPKKQHPITTLKQGDVLEIVTIVGGG